MKIRKQELMRYRLMRAHALGVRENDPARYRTLLVGVLQERERLEEIIESVPDARERTVLSLRYLHGLAWADVAEQMFYSLRWVMKIHRRALLRLEGEL